MAKYYEDLVHDITDARDYLAQESVGTFEGRRIRRAMELADIALRQGPGVEYSPDLIESLCDDIRAEIGGWCACIHAEVSASNPCACD